MDHAYIEKNQVVDRYLMEKLSTAEAARFEAHFLHCQQCLDQLELAETFVHDFRRVVAHQAAQTNAIGFGILAWLGRHRARQVALWAGAILVAVWLPVRFEQRLAEERQIHQQLTAKLAQAYQPQVNTLVLPLRQERGSPEAVPSRQIRLSSSPEWLVLALELDESRRLAKSYRVILIDENETKIWRSEAFEPDATGSLKLSLYSDWLEPGDYQIRAEAADSSDPPVPATHFSFRVLQSS